VTPSKWEVIVAPAAERSLARLREKVAAAVVEFMLGPLLEDPTRLGHRLRGELEGLWAARRGPYWVVCEVDARAKEVRVLRIDHRSDIYRPRYTYG
jgi:mRNA-degrading endonuclease RelE of RelBE toxin-antitoxin system